MQVLWCTSDHGYLYSRQYSRKCIKSEENESRHMSRMNSCPLVPPRKGGQRLGTVRPRKNLMKIPLENKDSRLNKCIPKQIRLAYRLCSLSAIIPLFLRISFRISLS